MRVRVVAFQAEVFEFKGKDVFYLRVYAHNGKRPGLPAQLQPGLVEVVQVKVGVAKGVHKIAGLQITHLGNHKGEQGIGGNIERHAQENVGAALIKLAGEFSIGHIKLEQHVTGGECHLFDLPHVPGTNHQPS